MLFFVFQFNSDSDLDWSPFEHNYKPAKLPNFDLSDDEGSSGISSTDNSLDNVLQGTTLPLLLLSKSSLLLCHIK
jgi:hypothetical protein